MVKLPEDIPSVTGVYLFTKKGKPLYVGKAINLKARLKSHFENAKFDRKEALIIAKSDDVEFIQSDSEFNALLLESRLIKIHHPRYNVRWKDDKSYLYIKVTVREKFPKIYLTRRENDKSAKYFGPFPSVQSCEEILNQIRKIFPFCTQKKLSQIPCFYSKIGLCNPCPNVIKTSEEVRKYRKNIRCVIKILEGKVSVILTDLENSLRTFSRQQKYEEALQLRNRINRFEKLIHQTQSVFDYSNNRISSESPSGKLYDLLKRYFAQLNKLERIECYDISNLSQKEATASMVVFVNGQSDKSQYRKFKIRNLRLRSDFEMLDEVIRRRLRNKWQEPDLIIVDGGKPQVRVFLKVLEELEKQIPVIGIAKRPDRIVIGSENLPTLKLPDNDSSLNLVRLLRDESHRFAKKYHVLLRNKKLLI